MSWQMVGWLCSNGYKMEESLSLRTKSLQEFLRNVSSYKFGATTTTNNNIHHSTINSKTIGVLVSARKAFLQISGSPSSDSPASAADPSTLVYLARAILFSNKDVHIKVISVFIFLSVSIFPVLLKQRHKKLEESLYRN